MPVIGREIDVITAARHRPPVDCRHAPVGSRQSRRRKRRAALCEERRWPAAAAKGTAIDGYLDLVGIDAFAHSVAAASVDDVHVDPPRLVYLAGDTRDRARRGLNHLQAVSAVVEYQVAPDRQIPEWLGPERAVIFHGRLGLRIRSGRRLRIGLGIAWRTRRSGKRLAGPKGGEERQRRDDHSHTATNPRPGGAVPPQIDRRRSIDPASLTSRIRSPLARSIRMLLESSLVPCASNIISGPAQAISVWVRSLADKWSPLTW